MVDEQDRRRDGEKSQAMKPINLFFSCKASFKECYILNMDKPLYYKQLLVWEKSVNMSKDIYEITKNFPQEERFALCSQMNRAAVSIPSNIAEGAMRNTKKDFVKFLHIALGSCAELDTQLTISQQLNFLSTEKQQRITNELTIIIKMLCGLIRKKNSSQRG